MNNSPLSKFAISFNLNNADDDNNRMSMNDGQKCPILASSVRQNQLIETSLLYQPII